MSSEQSTAPGTWWLKNGVQGLDLRTLPRCSATAKSTGQPCRREAMQNGRCYFHGGKSTGPRTPEGRAACARARTTHGRDTRRARAQRHTRWAVLREALAGLQAVMRQLPEADAL